MTRPEPGPTPRSWQQLLAAYVDGELDAADFERVRNWVEEHPEAYSRLEEQRSLTPGNTLFWEAVRPPTPDAIAWAGVWNRIEASLDRPAPSGRARLRSPWWRRGLIAALVTLPGAAAAAAVVTAVCLPAHSPPVAVVPIEETTTEEVFQVAAASDVEILSIRDADVRQLVVGEPPFNNPMNLVAAGDVRLEELQPANDGMLPEVRMGGTDAPLIYSPMPRSP